MSLTFQIFIGSSLLGICSLVHILVLILTAKLLRLFDKSHIELIKGSHWGVMLSFAFAMVVISHSIQIWIWALTFVGLGALPNIDESIYFALVTYTTLGYGDVTVSDGFRTFAAMAAVTGLLNFGLSTAFLVGMLSRALPDDRD